jgi:hypothetical protein
MTIRLLVRFPTSFGPRTVVLSALNEEDTSLLRTSLSGGGLTVAVLAPRRLVRLAEFMKRHKQTMRQRRDRALLQAHDDKVVAMRRNKT